MGEGGSTSHKDGGATRVARDEEAVERIVKTITNLVDPFKQDEVITHISSGKHDSPSIGHPFSRSSRVESSTCFCH